MRFRGAKVIAIDDQKAHLEAIVNALHKTGVGVLPFHYTGKRSLRKCFPGVRIVFSDISILASAGSETQQHRAVAAVLDELLETENGPWLLIAWTASPYQVDDLHKILISSLGSKAPMKSIGLDKSHYQTAQGGFRISKIAEAIEAKVADDPIIGAIFDLEHRAAGAAQDITRSIVALASKEQQEGQSTTVPDILRALSLATDAGSEPAIENVLRAVAPAFGDRLVRGSISASERAIWSQAFNASTKSLLPSQKAELNSSLHLDPAAGVGERGALTRVPANLVGSLARLYQKPLQEIIFTHFLDRNKSLSSLKIKYKGEREKDSKTVTPAESILLQEVADAATWWLVEVIPSCDASNRKGGLRRAFIGLSINHKLGIQRSAGQHVIALPTLDIEQEVVDIFVSARFTLSPLPRGMARLRPLCRLRDPLLDGLMQHVSNSQSRLGWVSF